MTIDVLRDPSRTIKTAATHCNCVETHPIWILGNTALIILQNPISQKYKNTSTMNYCIVAML